ncbi:MAG TPA: discoidin domain-containing protein [Treponemataceae bacterium]|nr:discoidin domain-containing protein [Treponemataceae bacterium]
MKLKLILVTVLCVLYFASCGKSLPDGELVIENSKNFKIRVNGRTREGTFYIPLTYDETRSYSLVFALHGASHTGAEFQKTTLFDPMAEEHDVIMVYPDGIGRRWDSAEDTALFEAMIKAFSGKYSIDSSRIYLAGFSAGAIKAYELAAVLPGRFAAIAPVAGAMRADADRAALAPTAVLHIHGKRDEEVPFVGLPEWKLLSAPESVELWKGVNGAMGEGEEFFRSRTAIGLAWEGQGHTVAQIFDDDCAHYWPPYASELILDFFYNNPARQGRLVIRRDGLPLTSAIGTVIPLRADITQSESTSPVEEVTWYTNGSQAAVSKKAPWESEWSVNLGGVRRLTAVARLADGTELRSTRNPFLLVSSSLSKDADTAGAETLLTVVDAFSTKIEDSTLEAKNAVDGDIYTRWGSEWTDNESLSLDLGSPCTVTALTLYWEMAYGKEYCIETSMDKESWTIVAQKNDGLGSIEFLLFPATQARYVRIRGIRRATEWGYSLFEVFVYGKK